MRVVAFLIVILLSFFVALPSSLVYELASRSDSVFLARVSNAMNRFKMFVYRGAVRPLSRRYRLGFHDHG
jgi:hypothetical protein